MILSRFWTLLLAVSAAAGLAAALLAQRVLQDQGEQARREALLRARVEVDLWLRLEPRSRLDAIAPLAAHRTVRETLAAASRGKNVDERGAQQLRETLRGLDRQLGELRSDLLFAVDRRGRIVVQLGGPPPPSGASLEAFPLVRRALEGYLRDDTWAYGDTIYRMVARPVVHQGRYVGAIVHGKANDTQLAERLGRKLPSEVTLAFVWRDAVLAAYVPSREGAVASSDVQAFLATKRSQTSRAAQGEARPTSHEERAWMLHVPLVGSAAHAGAGYVLAAPRFRLTSPYAIFERASREDVSALPWHLLGGAAVLLFLLGMLWFWLERDRPTARLEAAAESFANGERDKLPAPQLPGRYRRIAERINAGIERAAARLDATAGRQPANLDELLGQAPEPSASGGYFGFAERAEEPASPPTEAVPPAAAAPPEPPPPPPSPPSISAELNLPELEEEGEGATMVAQIPEELIRATLDAEATDPDEPHFREIYEQYLSTRRQCGEPTAGLRYERFRETLVKNRRQIIERHGASKVRFKVYVKQGKAALKAVPIKE